LQVFTGKGRYEENAEARVVYGLYWRKAKKTAWINQAAENRH
jgi:hypothetical protein